LGLPWRRNWQDDGIVAADLVDELSVVRRALPEPVRSSTSLSDFGEHLLLRVPDVESSWLEVTLQPDSWQVAQVHDTRDSATLLTQGDVAEAVAGCAAAYRRLLNASRNVAGGAPQSRPQAMSQDQDLLR
jgi:hypothetical protein